MKMSVEELGKWIAENPALHSARVNSDKETIAAEARYVFKDDVTEDDVTNAVQVYHTAQQAAAYAKAEGSVAAAAQAEG